MVLINSATLTQDRIGSELFPFFFSCVVVIGCVFMWLFVCEDLIVIVSPNFFLSVHLQTKIAVVDGPFFVCFCVF